MARGAAGPEPVLTLLVPTYNRPAELTRLLAFLSGAGCQFPVLVLDGSKLPAVQTLNRRTVEQHATAAYRSYPSELHLGLRIADGLRQVTTPYCAICPDDDIVFPRGLAACASFLEEHDDHAAAIGRVRAWVYASRGRTMLFPNALSNPYRLDQPRFDLRLLTLAALTPAGCPPLFYAVRRTAVALEAFSGVSAQLTYSAQEMLINCVTLARGSATTLPVAFGLRDYSSEATRDEIRQDPSGYFREGELEDIARFVSSRTGLDEGEVSRALESWFDVAALPPGAVGVFAQNRLARLHRVTERVVSALLPQAAAEALDIDVATYRALQRAQAQFRDAARRAGA